MYRRHGDNHRARRVELYSSATCRSPRIPHGQPIEVERLATVDDAAAIMGIYNVEVTGHLTTFDLVPRTIDQQRAWLVQRSGAFSAVVATLDDEVVGFGCCRRTKNAKYRTTVEDSVYVSRARASVSGALSWVM